MTREDTAAGLLVAALAVALTLLLVAVSSAPERPSRSAPWGGLPARTSSTSAP